MYVHMQKLTWWHTRVCMCVCVCVCVCVGVCNVHVLVRLAQCPVYGLVKAQGKGKLPYILSVCVCDVKLPTLYIASSWA